MKPGQGNSGKSGKPTAFLRPLLLATAIAGSLDIAYACLVSSIRGRMPIVVLQSVASGWQGTAAYAGGMPSALLGLVTHYGIMAAMAGMFGQAARRLPRLHEQPLGSGLLYGLGLYAVMYGIVLPLRFPAVFPRLNGWITLTDIAVHMAVGMIIAWVWSRSHATDPNPP